MTRTVGIEAGVRRFLRQHPSLIAMYEDTCEYRAMIGDMMGIEAWLGFWYWKTESQEAEHYGCIWTLIGNVTKEMYENGTT
jgi:hypothetical protein